MERDHARLAELGATDGHDAFFKIHVVSVDGDRLAHPHPRHGDQAEEGRVCGPSESLRRRQCTGGSEQVLHLPVAVDERCFSTESAWQESGGWHFGLEIRRLPPGREATDSGQSGGLVRGRGRTRLGRPAQGEVGRDVRGTFVLEERDKLVEIDALRPQLEPQSAARVEVVLQRSA